MAGRSIGQTVAQTPAIPGCGTAEECAARVAEFVRGPEFDPPPLPRIAQEVWTACAMGEASALQVAHVVHRDPIVAGRVMHLANTAHFSATDRAVGTLRDAIVRIGFEELLNVVLMISLKNALYALPHFAALAERSRRHAVAAALAASSLAEATGCAPSARAFLAGLLHDIGEPLVLHAVERVLARRDMAPDEAVACQASHALHGEVGALVADRWQLDIELRVVIARHHDDRALAECGPLLRLVRIADGLARTAAESLEHDREDGDVPLPDDIAGFPLSLLERVRDQIPTRLEEYDVV